MDLPGLAGPDEAATIERNIWDRIVPIVDFIVYVVQASTMTDQQSLTNYEKCLRILHGVWFTCTPTHYIVYVTGKVILNDFLEQRSVSFVLTIITG